MGDYIGDYYSGISAYYGGYSECRLCVLWVTCSRAGLIH